MLFSSDRQGKELSQPAATGFGSRILEELEAGEYLRRARPSDAVDASKRLDYAFRISPGGR